MLSTYYEKRGWDEQGVPKQSTLERLGLTEEAKQLNAYVKLEKSLLSIRPCKIHRFLSLLPTVNAVRRRLFFLEGSNSDGCACFIFNFCFTVSAAAPCCLQKAAFVANDFFEFLITLHTGGFFLQEGFGFCKQVILNFLPEASRWWRECLLL